MRLHPAKPLAATLLAATLVAGLAQALPSDRNQPLEISANQARATEKGKIITHEYKGAVLIRQGTLEIRADDVVIISTDDGVSSTVARGKPARYQQKTDPQKGPVTAEADRIDYDARNDTITLTGNARLKQDGASFQGSTITYNSQTQQVDAKGDGKSRVQLILPPSARDSKDSRKEGKK